MYRVTQIIPFPVARVEGRFVSYESYLFELRHFMHYYETQQKLSFDTEEGQSQLEDFKQQSIDKVINDAYVKYLADENDIEVTSQEVDEEIAIVRNQNRLGTSDQVFEDVLRDFWDWSVSDFKRSLKDQLLARKVASEIDQDAQDKANLAYTEIEAGADFGAVALKYSDDEATKTDGGNYGVLIDQSDREIPAKVTNVIFAQKAGEYSEIINTGYSLEIVKTLEFEGNKARAAHIQINFKPISEDIESLKESDPYTQYLKL
jgi:parvulin-like peptidyl-prolyl isomerase